MKDTRSINALDVAEKYANGLASNNELYAASDAAWSAWSAASDAAWSAQIDKLLEFFTVKENNQNFDWSK